MQSLKRPQPDAYGPPQVRQKYSTQEAPSEAPHNWPRISVVTPTYNQAAFLEQTIQSIIAQNYPNLEYMVLDGGSTDQTVEIIKRYSDAITYWRSGPDDGPYSSIGEGLSRASGDICAWLNGDDIYFPGALHCVGGIFRELPAVQWLTTLSPGNLNEWGDLSVGRLSGVGRASFWDGRHFPSDGTRLIGFIQQESTFFRASLWRQCPGLRREMTLAADFGLWCDLFAMSEIHATRRVLGAFRTHSMNRSRDMDRYAKEAREYFARFAGHSRLLASLPKFTAGVRGFDSIASRFQRAADWLGYQGQEIVRAPSGMHISRNYRYL